MAKADLSTLGDAVLRLSTDAASQLSTARELDLDVSGSEANVACHLARLGHSTCWCGCLPSSPLGKRVTLPLREAGVDISSTLWRDSGRVSSYYVEPAHPPRDAYVIYDRKDSCFEGLKADEIGWDALLDAKHFHATGITAALTDNTYELVATGLKKARKKGLVTSFDVNHRNLLWTPEDAKESISALLPDVDLLLCSARDAKKVFGIDDNAATVAYELAQLGGSKWVVVSDGQRNVTGIEDGKLTLVEAYKVVVEDRIGAGDGLAAGILHGLLAENFEQGLCCGAALAAFVLSVRGEQPDINVDELDRIVTGTNGDIRR